MSKLEAHERQTKKPWHRFALTQRGRMPWADWFAIRATPPKPDRLNGEGE